VYELRAQVNLDGFQHPSWEVSMTGVCEGARPPWMRDVAEVIGAHGGRGVPAAGTETNEARGARRAFFASFAVAIRQA
jgi:hypothetical protein